LNNLFKHANKELSTDAFLAWFFKELDKNPKLKIHISSVFSSLGLISDGEKPTNIEVKLQMSKVDLMLYFNVGDEKRSILFENKVWTSMHSKQLDCYREKFNNCTKYIYFKLGYIDAKEKKAIDIAGYSAISAFEFYDAVKGLSKFDPIIKHYCEFIKSEFIDKIDNALEQIEKPENPSIFKGSIAQKHMLGELYEQIKDSDDFIKFKTGSNVGGAPWAQLDICRRQKLYDGKDEALFWRVDKRTQKTYLRLSQYGRIPKDRKDLIELKKRRLNKIREVVNTICANYAVKRGKIINKGAFENEVVIFFFEENPYIQIKEFLPDLTRKIQQAYYLIE
jgi:hypothetical protein